MNNRTVSSKLAGCLVFIVVLFQVQDEQDEMSQKVLEELEQNIDDTDDDDR